MVGIANGILYVYLLIVVWIMYKRVHKASMIAWELQICNVQKESLSIALEDTNKRLRAQYGLEQALKEEIAILSQLRNDIEELKQDIEESKEVGF